MLHAPAANAMLEAWERGLREDAIERGLTLLALASPDDDRGALAAVALGERDRRLLELREALFGAQLHALAACPRCGEQVELECATRDLRAAAPAGDLVVHGDGHEIRLRLPDSRDLRAAGEAADADGARTALLERCVVSATVGGEHAAAAALSAELVAEAGRCLAEADPQIDMRFAVKCPLCGDRWSAPFDVVPFLWTEIDAAAVGLLADVHALASAYGWSESEILSLGTVRRESYLRMAGT